MRFGLKLEFGRVSLQRRLALMLVAVGVLVPATPAQTVSTSELEGLLGLAGRLSVADDDLAKRLRKLKLRTQVPTGLLETYSAGTLGPRASQELERLARDARRRPPESAVAAARAPGEIAVVVQPPQEEQQRILERIRAYAAGYAASIPNFTCLRDAEHTTDNTGLSRWRNPRRLTEQLQFVDGDEEKTPLALNGKPVRGRPRLGSSWLSVNGEFGNLIRRIFDADTNTEFRWHALVSVPGGRRAVFRYRVPQSSSSLRITVKGKQVTLGYGGEIEADPGTGEIYRVRYSEYAMPDGFPLRGSEGTVEYDWVEIEGEKYLLPVRAAMLAYLPPNFISNRMRYREYRKYDAASTIRFGPPAEESDAGGAAPPDGGM